MDAGIMPGTGICYAGQTSRPPSTFALLAALRGVFFSSLAGPSTRPETPLPHPEGERIASLPGAPKF